MITCPFHGWRYNLDGTLRGPAFPDSLPKLDRVEYGLKPVDMDIWMGFVFVRFLPGDQPPISRVLARHDAEVAPYGTDAMVPAAGEFWTQELGVNWKAVRDVDNEGYHVPEAHPSLQDLYGKHYYDEPLIDGTSRAFAELTDRPGRLWSVRHYKKILPDRVELPMPNRRAWLYVGLFPNTVIAFYSRFDDLLPGDIRSPRGVPSSAARRTAIGRRAGSCGSRATSPAVSIATPGARTRS